MQPVLLGVFVWWAGDRARGVVRDDPVAQAEWGIRAQRGIGVATVGCPYAWSGVVDEVRAAPMPAQGCQRFVPVRWWRHERSLTQWTIARYSAHLRRAVLPG